jgi:hypothetical protein
MRIKSFDAQMEVAVDLRISSPKVSRRMIVIGADKKRSRDPARDPCFSFTRRRKECLYYTSWLARYSKENYNSDSFGHN